MRIVHFAETGTPTNIQGNHRHILYLAGTQRARGMNAAVVTSKHGLFFNLCDKDGIPVFVVDDLLPSGDDLLPSGEFAPGFTQGIVARLKDLSPEIIHCHDLSMAQAVVAAANIIKVPCVVTLHEGGVGRIIPDIIAAKRAGRKFTIIAVSKKEFEVMQENGMAGIDFHYVPNGTRTPSGAHQQEQSTSCRPNLMTVANLGFIKGIDLAILAMAELRRRRGSDCPVLSIYGAGELGEYLIEMAKVLGLDDVVKFHGIQMDILDKCPSSDVLIVPSRFETGPLTVPEAMSRGMPIVACDVGQVAEMLPDWRYGRIVPVNSITVLADAMDSMLTDIASGQFDPDLLVKRHQSQYSIEKVADRIATVYQSAIARLELA